MSMSVSGWDGAGRMQGRAGLPPLAQQEEARCAAPCMAGADKTGVSVKNRDDAVGVEHLPYRLDGFEPSHGPAYSLPINCFAEKRFHLFIMKGRRPFLKCHKNLADSAMLRIAEIASCSPASPAAARLHGWSRLRRDSRYGRALCIGGVYSDRGSRCPIDPCRCTDAGCAYPAGDPFLVYPGRDGRPEDSIRYEVFTEGLQDQRAMQFLETKMPREEILKALDRLSPEGKMGIAKYPRGEKSMLAVRAKINRLIGKCSA